MESRQFRRADGVLGVGFVQTHTGREVAAIAWPDVEPRRIELIDLAGHGIELVPVVTVTDMSLTPTESEVSLPSWPASTDVWPELVIIPDTVTPEEHAELVKPADIVEPTEPLHMTVPAELFAEQALTVPDVAAEPVIAVEVANDPPGMAG